MLWGDECSSACSNESAAFACSQMATAWAQIGKKEEQAERKQGDFTGGNGYSSSMRNYFGNFAINFNMRVMSE